jgi:hypothetical protein
MKGGAQAALALGVGYILGRRRKMRLATMLAIGAASGAVGGLGPAVVRRGAKYLGSTDIAGALGPQVGEIVSTVRGELLDAAKGAAAAAVTSRIDSLSDSLHDRAETLKNPEAAAGRAGKAAGETASRAGGTVGRLRRRGRPADDDEAAELDQDEERDEDARSNGRARRERPRARRSAPETDEADEPQDDYEEPEDEYEDESLEDEVDEGPAGEAEEPDEEPDEEDEQDRVPRRRASRSPVTRTRR